MKTIFTTLLAFCVISLHAQSDRSQFQFNHNQTVTYNTEGGNDGKIFIHTSDPVNSSGGDGTIMDHPLLNNNPNARPIVSHVWNGVVNNKISGVYYDAAAGRWLIYNEDSSVHTQNAKYMVYVPDSNYSIQHLATSTNVINAASVITNPLLDNQPNRNAVVTHVYVNERINKNIGLYNYGGSKRGVFFEDLTAFIHPSTYHVAVAGESAIQTFRIKSDAINTPFDCVRLDHPLLNNNPNAKLVYSHMWDGDYLDHVTYLYFNPSIVKWVICSEDSTDIPLGNVFDVFILDDSMSVEDINNQNSLKAFPNPMKDLVTLSSDKLIQEVKIMNMAGQILLENSFDQKSVSLSVNSLSPGVYLAQVKTDKGIETLKLIKK